MTKLFGHANGMANPFGPLGNEAAAYLGVSRRTIYKWIDEGRLAYPLTWDGIKGIEKRPRGPRRSPHSKRYTIGRHSFEKSGNPSAPALPTQG